MLSMIYDFFGVWFVLMDIMYCTGILGKGLFHKIFKQANFK